MTVFAELHKGRPFVLANAWDAASASLMESSGAVAIGTSSLALAKTMGLRDGYGQISRDETFANARTILKSTSLPVSADLENGFGRSPETCAETIRMAVDLGLSGCSIEDLDSGDSQKPYEFNLAVERIAAAAEAVRATSSAFVLTARAEGLWCDNSPLEAIITRLQAFEEVGADVLFAPGLTKTSDIATICASLSKPVNVLVGPSSLTLSLEELGELGVKRVSLGGGIYRTAMVAAETAARKAISGQFPY